MIVVVVVGGLLLAWGALWSQKKGTKIAGWLLALIGAPVCFIGWQLMELDIKIVPGPPAVDCRADFECWTNSHKADANSACRPYLERLAQYDFRWTYNPLDGRFSRASVSDDGDVITYVGDRVEFQNGFGAWMTHTYSCTYSASTASVLSVDATPGRL